MNRISTALIAALAATGLALGGTALAQKAEAPKSTDTMKNEAPKKSDAPKTTDTKKGPASTEVFKTEAPTKGADKKAAEPMDINSASEKDLAKLKGIGDVRAKAIVKGRPYKGKDDLVTKKIIPQNVYDDIKDQIIAHQKVRSPG